MTDSLNRNDTRTYVWDQNGIQTISVLSSINLGTHEKDQEYLSSAQIFSVTDNRNVRAGKHLHVEAAVTSPFKLTTDVTKVIGGDPLYYHNTTTGVVTHLGSTAQEVYSGQATNSYQDFENCGWKLGFKSSPKDIPKAGY